MLHINMKHANPTTVSGAPPRHRHKFFCSHGGKILPRPTDGQLKYVGGETRCISVPRGITFRDFMKRLTYMVDGEMILKYQLVTEDLDALVSVKSDEDVAHMLDEMENYESAGYPRMRAFLFPINHALLLETPIPVEQRYIYSINGINTNHLSPSPSPSPCSSPRSPNTSTPQPESLPHNNGNAIIRGSPKTCTKLNHLHPLVSMRSVGRSDGFTSDRRINQSCTKCITCREDHRGRFYDSRIIERQATLPAHF